MSNLFGNEPHEQAMTMLMHDSARSLSVQEYTMKDLRKLIDGLTVENKAEMLLLLSQLESSRRLVQHYLDKYCLAWKNDFKKK